MPTAKSPAKTLLSSFKELGLSATQARHFVPDWWDDEAALQEGGLLELQILLARRLNVALDSLQSESPKPVFREANRRFKTVHPQGSTQLSVSAGIGHGLAHLLASACKTPLKFQGLSASQMRALLLEGCTAVTLSRLCTWLWHQGIPVVHIQNWPNQLRRPDAMCVKVGDRPVILVVRKEVAPAKLAYLVAHEVGHVMSGHLKSDGNSVLVDDTLPVDAQEIASDDEEAEADAYAMTLLGGAALLSVCKSLTGRTYDELTLAVAALQASKGAGLDAGQVILGWARLSQDWKLAAMALRYLMTTQTAPEVINDIAARAMEMSALSGDGVDHLARLTGIQLGET